MPLANTSASALPAVSTLLQRIYDFVGAHTNALRAENERDRARQRAVMPSVAVAWVYLFHHIAGTPITSVESVWMISALIYAASALAFRAFLRFRPNGGVHVQYAFLALDPLIVG